MPKPKMLQQPKFTTLYLSFEMYERLRETAYSQGKSVSQLVREIVERYLREHSGEA
jgi:predicted DNA-binding protein